MIYQQYIKRFLDMIFGLVGFILLFPIFLVVLIILSIVNKGKPIFLQARPGYRERIFKIMKFQTMTNACDAHGDLLPDNERLTAVGRFVRTYSLDEIPQLINIIKGDMSFIGPRPLRVQYLPYYTEEERLRHTVRPGITGLAQVSGRNLISWDEKFQYDVAYVRSISLKTDLKIFWQTILKIFNRSEVVVSTHEIMDLDKERKAKMAME